LGFQTEKYLSGVVRKPPCRKDLGRARLPVLEPALNERSESKGTAILPGTTAFRR